MSEQDERSKNATPDGLSGAFGGGFKKLRESPLFAEVHEALTNEAIDVSVVDVARRLKSEDPAFSEMGVQSIRVELQRYKASLPKSEFIRRAWVEARDKLDERFSEVAELQRLCIMQLERLMKLLAFEDEAQFPAAQTGIEADKLARWLKDLLSMRQSLGLTRKEPEKVEATVEHREARKSEHMREFLKRTMGWTDEQIDRWLKIPPCVIERSLAMNAEELQSLGASGEKQRSSSSELDTAPKQRPEEALKPAANPYQTAMEKAGIPKDQREYGKRRESQTAVGCFQKGLFSRK
jgi:hypothetical protein